jgi:hypothetical protein
VKTILALLSALDVSIQMIFSPIFQIVQETTYLVLTSYKCLTVTTQYLEWLQTHFVVVDINSAS